MKSKINSVRDHLPENIQSATELHITESCTAGEVYRLLQNYTNIKKVSVGGAEYKRDHIGKLSSEDRLGGGASGRGETVTSDRVVFGDWRTGQAWYVDDEAPPVWVAEGGIVGGIANAQVTHPAPEELQRIFENPIAQQLAELYDAGRRRTAAEQRDFVHRFFFGNEEVQAPVIVENIPDPVPPVNNVDPYDPPF